MRFTKGLSRDLPLEALERATQLMLELAGGKAAKGIVDVYPGKRQMMPILMSTTEAKRLLGINVGVDEMVRTLELLGFDCERTESPLQVRVSIPWWRTDVNCAADLAEELARIIGYDNIPTTMISAPIPMHEPLPMQSVRQRTKNTMVSCGFQEVLTYALTNLDVLGKLSPELYLTGPMPVKLANPMSREMEYLRPSLRANILSVLNYNQRHNESGIRLFEIGKVFIPREGDLPQEKEMLCAVLTSTQPKLSWRSKAESVDFFVAKGVVETIMTRLGLAVDFELAEDKSLYSGRSANILVDNNQIGVVGELHPSVLEAFELSDAAYLIEIDMDRVLSLIDSSKKYEPISRYPSTSRDVALVLDEQTTYQQVYSIARDFPLVKQVTLFDLYSGEQVPAGKKSFAFRIVYQSPAHTLTDKEVDKVQQKILDKLSGKLGAVLRA